MCKIQKKRKKIEKRNFKKKRVGLNLRPTQNPKRHEQETAQRIVPRKLDEAESELDVLISMGNIQRIAIDRSCWEDFRMSERIMTLKVGHKTY